MKRMRLFVAIPLPASLRSDLEPSVAEWRRAWPDARWARLEDCHVTLRFLGEVPEEQLPAVQSWMREQLKGVQGGVFRLGRTGHFGRRGRYVLWAGLADAEWVNRLAARLGGVVAGCSPEEREFRAHLTLARTEVDRRNEAAFVEFMNTFDGSVLPPGGEVVDEVMLYRSELSSQGARYSVMERVKLL